jgi:hypothetical protein
VTPRFLKVAANETQQLNGPWWGLRVLAFAAGAQIRINGDGPLPVMGTFSLPATPDRPWDRLELTGPITVQLAPTPETVLAGAPGAVASPYFAEEVASVTAAENAGGSRTFLRPDWATRLFLQMRKPIGGPALANGAVVGLYSSLHEDTLSSWAAAPTGNLALALCGLPHTSGDAGWVKATGSFQAPAPPPGRGMRVTWGVSALVAGQPVELAAVWTR